MWDKEIIQKTYRTIMSGNAEEARKLFDDNPGLITYRLGRTWLHDAARVDNVPMVALLVELGIDVNSPESAESIRTPLSYAASSGRVNVARWLIEHGADVNLDNPLAGAATSGSLEIVRMLLEKGADPNVVYGTMEYGDPPRTALGQAEMYGHTEVASLLRQYGAKQPSELCASSTDANDFQTHLATHLGNPEPLSHQEIVPGNPPISIHLVRTKDALALVTEGMSSRPMTVPKGNEEYRLAELVIYLPRSWPLSPTAMEAANNSWPIDWLRRIARYPHEHKSWFGGPSAVIANGDPPRPLAPNTRLTCILAVAEESEFGQLRRPSGDVVTFYTLIPIYTEERDLERKKGIEHLIRLFQKRGIGFVVDINRPNVAKSAGRK